jgi:hypothetical protein
MVAVETHAPDAGDGPDLEGLVLVVAEPDPCLVQGLVAAPSGVSLGGIGVDPMQIAAQVYRAAGGTFGGGIERNERSIEGRQLQAQQFRELIAPAPAVAGVPYLRAPDVAALAHLASKKQV